MGTLQTNPETLPDTVTNSWQPLIQRDALGYAGMNKVTLTNWDETTTKPLVAQGSIIDIDGSLAVFALDEAITDVAADGTVYLKFVVSGSTVTPEFTAEVPTWYADKAGWYNAAGERFSGHNCLKAGTAYSNKSRFMDEETGDARQLVSNGTTYMEKAAIDIVPSGVNTDNTFLKFKKFSGSAAATPATFAHGLDWTKILGISFSIASGTRKYSFWNQYGASSQSPNRLDASVSFDATNIYIDGENNPGLTFNYGDFTMVVFYEA